MTSLPYDLGGVFSYSNLVHAVSGAAGSVVGLTAFFPLDTVRTRLQVLDGRKSRSSVELFLQIFHEEGIHGLYKGWLPVVSSLCCSNFVYFYVYSSLKAMSLKGGHKPNPAQHLGFAFIAGVVNVLLTTPLWVANTRLKLQGTSVYMTRGRHLAQYNGMFDCLVKISQVEGLAGLWSGTIPSLVLVGNPAVQFMVYETLKYYLQTTWETKELSGLTYFFLGAIGKLIATIVTYPWQLIQTRWRAGKQCGGARRKTMLQTLKEIIRHNGWSGIYQGLGPKLAQTVLMSALMFLTYEKIAAFVFHMMVLKPETNR